MSSTLPILLHFTKTPVSFELPILDAIIRTIDVSKIPRWQESTVAETTILVDDIILSDEGT